MESISRWSSGGRQARRAIRPPNDERADGDLCRSRRRRYAVPHCSFPLTRVMMWYILIYTMFLYELAAALEKAEVPFAIVGGYAVALHGAVRGTVDVDIILRLSRSSFLAAESALRTLGLAPRLPVSAGEVFD